MVLLLTETLNLAEANTFELHLRLHWDGKTETYCTFFSHISAKLEKKTLILI